MGFPKESNSPTSVFLPTRYPQTMLKIPKEINERILIMSEPSAIAAMAQSCLFFHNLINRPVDQHLWRSIFLARFDDPRLSFEGYPNHFPWAEEFQRRCRSQTYLRRRKFETLDPAAQVLTFETLADVILRSPPVTHCLISQDLEWASQLIGSGDVLQNWCTEAAQQRQAQLRMYFDLTTEHKDVRKAETLRTGSRAFVYDLRRYTESNLYGPFLWNANGRVSWIHLEHIYRVMALNIAEILELYEDMIPPTGLAAVRPYSAPKVDPTSIEDWAGIEGRWYRYVCFMDYRDLHRYNFSRQVTNSEPLNTAIFKNPDFFEAIRLIELKLQVNGSYPCRTHPRRPVLKFIGSSKGAQGNEARVKGIVFMTPDDQVRWKFVSVYDGRTQWASEGIQIGGIASSMGIMGVWTGAQHLYQDPVGPFWLWKVGNPA